MTPNPGSEEARLKGCTCPVIDNHFGKGRPNGDFIYNFSCPLHGVTSSDGAFTPKRVDDKIE